MKDTIMVTENRWLDRTYHWKAGTKNLGAQSLKLDGITYRLVGTGTAEEYRKGLANAVHRPLTVYTYEEIPAGPGFSGETVEITTPETVWFYEPVQTK